ncbi:preprotein translocase subunit SecG [Kangiella sediminilitoris]|uniref:Protein-export membrane protein SecG n=1 Tax=Kangiella sediminilitoris TaxID=1144748 RepID=A0A1B3B883_9GAMM|nr:preprotein translocase subunit SecG [Kangiella sediminilitoris]AOE48990.1 Preprotein translocase, SecG subunit [Kangiella sediminilitoris]
MELFLMISLLVVALLLIGVILIQQGKGAEMGASFGAGASNTLFGAPGSGNFLTKSTTVLAIVFFAIALAIGALNSHETANKSSLLDDVDQTEQGAAVESSEIPAETNEAISTEIPAEANDEISAEIPTEEQASDEIAESIDAAAEAAASADEVKDDAEEGAKDEDKGDDKQ